MGGEDGNPVSNTREKTMENKPMYYYRYDPVRMKFGVYQIIIGSRGKYHMLCHDANNTKHYWTRVHPQEGKVMNNGVWFKEPKLAEALEKLKLSAGDRIHGMEDAIQKSRISYEAQDLHDWR